MRTAYWRAAIGVAMGLLTATAPAAHADAIVTLGWLTQDLQNSVTAGDKIFDRFTVSASGVGTFGVDPDQIEVLPLTAGDYGLRLQPLAGQDSLIWAAGASSFADLLVGFRVRVLDAGRWINGVSLGFSGVAPADGLAQVIETVSSGLDTWKTKVELPSPTSASRDLPGLYQELEVSKDIAVIGGAEGLTSITQIDQRFPQIPEPGAVLLVGLGLLLLPRGYFRSGPKRGPTALALAGALLLTGGAAPANASVSYTLAGLVADQQAVVPSGDKLFNHFGVTVLDAHGRTFFDPAAIQVTPISIAGEPGLRFGGLFAALAASNLDVQIRYDVTAPGQLISGASMRFNGDSTGEPSGTMVTEILMQGGLQQAWLDVQSLGSGVEQLTDHLDLLQTYSTLQVVSDVSLLNGDDWGAATISFIDQTFQQVPEPAAGLLLATGLLLVRRGRRS